MPATYSPTFEFVGTAIRVCEPQTFASGFRKRDLIVKDDNDRFPQEIPFTAARDTCDVLDQIKIGARVKLRFSLDGHEYKGKWFPSVRLVKLLELANPGTPVAQQAPAAQGATPPPANIGSASGVAPATATGDDSLDDLPF